MGRHCAAFGCTNNSSKTSCKEKNISFHSFPINDPDRLKKWLLNLRRKDFVPKAYTAICSEHFDEDNFTYQMFTRTRMLKKTAIPTKFCFQTSFENISENMEDRIKSQLYQGKNFKAFVGKAEKKCNKCGFVTFCLHVLYNHKYKCQGQLLGKPTFCSYCKRKFDFIALYRTHTATCVKRVLRKKFLQLKLKEKHLRNRRKSKQNSPYKYSFSCPICHTAFKSKLKFVSHLKQQSCTAQKLTTKISFSARKSFNNVKNSKASRLHENKNHHSESKFEKYLYESNNNKQFWCTWCKSVYPSEKLLFMHLSMNEKCAEVYHQSHTSNTHKKASMKARKTIRVVAKKSFPHKKHIINEIYSSMKNFSSGSARKTLTSSKKKKYGKFQSGPSNSSLNQCPVCYKDFPDTFTFFQHQKMLNHWGKATKSFTTSCKCPFCDKEFLHIKSRNSHVRNHSDRSEDEIKAFLRSCVCSVCSQIFVSELAKLQHMKIEHPSCVIDRVKFSGSGSEHNAVSDNEFTTKDKMSSVPSSMKRKLKQQPNTCPVCSKAFSHTVLRNKHFNEVHLKIFECQYCNTKFKSTSSLFNHIQVSHGKNFDCKECRANFINELQLLQHVLKSHPSQDPKLFLPSNLMKSTSSKEKLQDTASEIRIKNVDKLSYGNDFQKKNLEYYCDVCDIGYQKLCGLQRHRQSKFHKDTLVKNLDAFHKSLSDIPPSPTPPYPRVVKHPEILTCSECSEDFTNIKDFVPHRLSHFSVQSKYLKINELNPYMCEICSDVLDSHSKVQLHLFWHLQIESTSNKSASAASNKNDTIVPDRLSGQHVAKKSFSKQSSESLQEVVIGGVKKPLFTCEACNIGFTTKGHYNVHVRKLCKKLKSSKHFSKNSGSEVINRKSDSTKYNVYCSNCNCLFASSMKFEQHKEFCIKCYFDNSSEESLSNSDIIKSALDLGTAVAGCVTCAAIFDDISCVAGHLIIHKTDISTHEDIVEDVLHCALCNCLFTLQAFKLHKDFCKIPVNIGSKITNLKHINVLKSALELKCAIAACISCGVPFDDLDTFSNHLTLHQTNQIQNETIEESLCNGETSVSAINIESENSLADNSADFLLTELADSLATDNQDHISSSLKSFDFVSDLPSNSGTENNKSALPELKQTDETVDSIEDLRKNFSQLLCLLISDPELMQKLGYGKQLVDDVLINVLQQMGQEPCTDDISDIDQLRKNIQILLDLCLKDQVMQVIGKGNTTDEMVIEALKIFASDENTFNDED